MKQAIVLEPKEMKDLQAGKRLEVTLSNNLTLLLEAERRANGTWRKKHWTQTTKGRKIIRRYALERRRNNK